jgi:hypothetical protein
MEASSLTPRFGWLQSGGVRLYYAECKSVFYVRVAQDVIQRIAFVLVVMKFWIP